MKNKMKKIFKFTSKLLPHSVKYCVRIVKTIKGEEFLPMLKAPGLFNDWTPIVKIYNKYHAMNYEKDGGLTIQECYDHIKSYKEQVIREIAERKFEIEYKAIVDTNEEDNGNLIAGSTVGTLMQNWALAK